LAKIKKTGGILDMPLTATFEDIKAYQEKVEKNKITSDGLAPCPRCNLEPQYFKIHAYRERRFLIIVDAIIEVIYCALVRFRCINCGKTLAIYPDFALPHKHYTRQTAERFSRIYLQDDRKTYKDATMTVDGLPTHLETGRALAPSTIHRWITTLAGIFMVYQQSRGKALQKMASARRWRTQICGKKYRTQTRKAVLLRCRDFLALSAIETVSLFSPSLQ
jgi:transposase-like protein